MIRIIKRTFIESLTGLVCASNNAKCVLLGNQKCETPPTFIDLHPNEYSQEFHYYQFTVKLDKKVGSCNTLNELSNKACVSNIAEDFNLSVLNIIIGINESKTLTKHILCECKCKFDGKNCNSDQSWKNDKTRRECKKRHVCKKDYVWNPATCKCENRKYLASIMDDSAIMCDEIKESYNNETNFHEK